MDEFDQEAIRELEVNAMVDLYDRCLVSNSNDSTLSTGETVCINRCVGKFFEVHNVIGQKIQEITLAEQRAQMDSKK